jgi:hypothetical protein
VRRLPKGKLTRSDRDAGARLTLALGRQHLVSDTALKSARKDLKRLKQERLKPNEAANSPRADIEHAPVYAAFPAPLSDGTWGANVGASDAAEGDLVNLSSGFESKRLVAITEVLLQGRNYALVRIDGNPLECKEN